MLSRNHSTSSQQGESLSLHSFFPDKRSPDNTLTENAIQICSSIPPSVIGSSPSTEDPFSYDMYGQLAYQNIHPNMNVSSNFIREQIFQTDGGFTESPLGEVPHSAELRTFGLTRHVPLYLAALKGDWKSAQAYLQRYPHTVCAKITRGLETALHIAAGARHVLFVEGLVSMMSPGDLELCNRVGNTALCFAAASGIKKIAEIMVEKNDKLPLMRGSQGATPLYMAALLGHREMVWYLYYLTEHSLSEEELIGLLVAAITSNLFDVALKIISSHPTLATVRDGNGETALHVLARKPSAFYSGSQLGIWQKFIYSC